MAMITGTSYVTLKRVDVDRLEKKLQEAGIPYKKEEDGKGLKKETTLEGECGDYFYKFWISWGGYRYGYLIDSELAYKDLKEKPIYKIWEPHAKSGLQIVALGFDFKGHRYYSKEEIERSKEARKKRRKR